MKLYIANTTFFSQSDYNKYYAMMSKTRASEIDRKKFDDSKRESVLGEMLARKGISELTGIDEEKIIFSRTENGKPYADNTDIFFSISHSKEYVVCAVDKDGIGVDIEQIRAVEPRITNISCTESDKEYIFGTKSRDTFDADSLERFFVVWTAKEAYLKCKGTGIVDLKTVSYNDIAPYCKTFNEYGYVISVYSKNDFEGMMLRFV